MNDYDKRRIRKAIAEKDEPWVRHGTLADLADHVASGRIGDGEPLAEFLERAMLSGRVRELCDVAAGRGV